MALVFIGFCFVIVRFFVLLNNYGFSGLQKHVFLIKSDIRHFFVHFSDVWKVRHNYVSFWIVNLLYLFLRQNFVINAFIIRDVRIMFLCGTFHYVWNNVWTKVWKLRFALVCHCDVFFISYNYVFYLINLVTFYEDVKITLHFGTFELRMDITWKLRFDFVRHCDLFFISSQLHYLFVPCSYIF